MNPGLRRSRRGLAVLLCALLAMAGVGASAGAGAGAEADLSGGDFTLTADDGRPLSTRELRGQVVLLAFGYTHCPDICPTTLMQMARVAAQLGARSDQVALLFVTLDPQRDTVAHLRGYVGYFHPRLRGLTGPAAVIAEVAAQYGVRFAIYRRAPDAAGYAVDHSTDLYLLDRRGRLAAMVPYGTPESRILQLVRELLDAPATPVAAAGG